MKKRELSVEELQITVAEKLKLILLKLNGKNVMFFEYNKKTENHIGLMITWYNNDRFLSSKTFLSSSLNVIVYPTNDPQKCLISLDEILTSAAHKKVNDYYDKQCNEKINESHVKEVFDILQHPTETNEDLKETSSLNGGQESKPEEIKPVVAMEIKQNPASVEKMVIKPAVIKPTKGNSILKTKQGKEKTILGLGRGRKASPLLLNNFFLHLYAFEAGLDSPVVKLTSSKILAWDIVGDLQVLLCQDDVIASKLEIGGAWHIENNYSVGPTIIRENNKIIVDSSLFQNFVREKKSTTRSYCLPPNESSTILDMKERFHRIYYLSNPSSIEKIDNYFKVEYKKKRLAKYIHEVILGMGWNSEVDGNHLLIFPGSALVSTEAKETIIESTVLSVTSTVEAIPPVIPTVDEPIAPIEETSIPKVSQDDLDLSIAPMSQYTFNGTKEEALAKLKELYNNPIFCSDLSEETKNDINFVLEENWKIKHIEEYARVLLDFLKNN